MSKMDLLLKLDAKKINRPTKEVEITRLSEVLGEPFLVTCQALTGTEFEELQKNISISASGEVDLDKNIQVNTVITGVKDPDLSNQKFIEKFGAINAAEAVSALFLPGEVSSIYATITELSGFGKQSVVEIKN